MRCRKTPAPNPPPAEYEEAVRATSYQAHVELRAQADRIAPVEAPDGFRPLLGPLRGRRRQLRRR